MNSIAIATCLVLTGIAADATAQTPPPGAAVPPPPRGDDRPLTRAEAAARADARFAKLDADHDGSISADERRGARAMRRDGADQPAAMTAAEYRERALRRFDHADTNHDGVLDPAERQAERDRMRDRHAGPGDDSPPPPPTPR